MNASVNQYRQKLDDLFGKVDDIEDLELKKEWARYLYVRTSGFVETSVEEILAKYAEDQSSPAVANYVASTLRRFTSANKGNIAEVLGRFDEGWQSRFEEAVVDDLQGSLNSVISNRHNIAHGREVGLSYAQMKRYYANVVQVVDVIDGICSSA